MTFRTFNLGIYLCLKTFFHEMSAIILVNFEIDEITKY